MPSLNVLLEDFVESRNDTGDDGEGRDFTDAYRTENHTLFEVIHREPHAVAGWQDPGTTNASIWIGDEWRGGVRRNLEDELRAARLVILTVVPSEDMDQPSADIIWWAYPVECMSCGDDLTDDQRPDGLCPACIELRGDIRSLLPESQQSGIQQQRGLHGSRLPRSRPTG